MENKSLKLFPYEYISLKPEEIEEFSTWFKSPFIDYVRVGPKGYVLPKDYLRDANNIYNMHIKSNDIFVMSYMRSGTTWTQELVWLLANDLDYAKAAAEPITQRYPCLELFILFTKRWRMDFIKKITETENEEHVSKVKDMLEFVSNPATGVLSETSPPRFIKTHIPLSLLPPGLINTAKVVYIARDPRDVAVSLYHQNKLFDVIYKFEGGFKEFWTLFTKNLILLTPYFEGVKEAWEKRHHPNMLFLFYEELSKDLPGAVLRVSDFLGKIISTEELLSLCEHLNIENFKKNKSVNYEMFREVGICAPGETFIRKGKAGGWRDHFDAEMSLQAERWIAENLRDTDLRFSDL